MTILIVEDNPSVRRLLRRAVSSEGTFVIECSNGIDCLPAYVQGSPDIVLMDIQMPGVDGLEATRRLRRFDPNAKVIMVTDFDDEGMRAAARDCGVCAYVLKEHLSDLEPVLKNALLGNY